MYLGAAIVSVIYHFEDKPPDYFSFSSLIYSFFS